VPEDVQLSARDKRDGVTAVELVFALPLSEGGAASAEEPGQFFAFLPVRSYGFRWVRLCGWRLA
jgi:hypothetical protein